MTELRYQDYHSVDYDACIAILTLIARNIFQLQKNKNSRSFY